MKNTIRGAGGGGSKSSSSKQRAAVVSPDSLVSTQYARVLDLLSEGEIEGLVNGLQSVYLDDTPLQNADGSLNFAGFTIETRSGSPTQSYIGGFPSTESAYSVSVEVTHGTPVVRQVTNTNLDAVRINVAVPQLYYQNPKNGDVTGSSISLVIDVQPNAGTWQTLVSDTIAGKASSRYNRNYLVALPGSGPWNIRITKTSPDSDNDTARDLYWESLTEIIDAKLRYPNSALVGITIDASQFNAIPSRSYDTKGLRIKVPSNYNPATRAYTGIWDGTFQVAWSDNPAWCFYDLLTNERYGLGEFITPDQVDKAGLYTIGRYCDELVPDGFGGMEPRFTCNLYLQTREEAYKVLSDMAGLFAGILFWASGGLTCAQDSPADAVYQFTNANVIDGLFTYNGSSRAVRHTTALVSYNDPADRYARKVEYVEDTEGIQRYGVRQAELVAIGCASRGQAHRMGKRILLTERYLTETVTFRVALEYARCWPGAVIEIMDNDRVGSRLGGRIRTATTSSVTLDKAVTLEGGDSYVLSVILPDGTVEKRGVVPAVGEVQTLDVILPFSAAPIAQSVWVLTPTAIDAQLFKVTSVKELDGMLFEVTALAYNPSKFDAIEQNIAFEPLKTSLFESATVQAAPTNLVVGEALFQSSVATVDVRMDLSWDAPVAAQWLAGYRVSWRQNDGNWNQLPDQTATTAEVFPMQPGPVDVRVVAFNRLGVVSQPATASKVLVGKTAIPVDVTGFSVIKSAGFALVSWEMHPDLDVRVGGSVVVRHTPDTVDPAWENSYALDTFVGSATSGLCPLMTGVYMAKAIDSSGNYSADAAMFVATEGMVTGFTTVGSVIEDPGFSGAKIDVSNAGSAIQLDGVALIDDLLDPVDSWGTVDALGGIVNQGSYAFSSVLDLGTVATRRFIADLAVGMFDVGDWVDARTDLIDDWPDIDGVMVNDCDVTLYASTTDDNPSGSPAWGAWTPFFVADFTCRAARFRLDIESNNPQHNMLVTRLRVTAKVPV